MGGELSRFRYVYVFDRGYRFQLHLDALDASEEAVKCVSVVSRNRRGRLTGVAEILRIRDREELMRLAEISPFFEWTAKASRGQHFGQTWAYFFGQ